jgi:hypothetical protein
MYLSTMMADLYAYMQQSVEEAYNEDEYEEYQQLLQQLAEFEVSGVEHDAIRTN